MRRELLVAKETYLACGDFRDSCACAFSLYYDTPTYKYLCSVIEQLTGKPWNYDYLTDFSAEERPHEFYLMVFDKALEGT